MGRMCACVVDGVDMMINVKKSLAFELHIYIRRGGVFEKRN